MHYLQDETFTYIDASRAALPPIKHIDFDSFKRERDEHDYQSRHINMTSIQVPKSAAPSPSYQYPSGPPPPYSHPAPPVQKTIGSPVPMAGIRPRTPSDARRMSGDDQDKLQASKQSLPSIHEALGVEQSRPYPVQPPYSAAPPASYSAPAPPSPPASRKSFGMEPPPPPLTAVSYANNGRRSPGPQYRSEISPRTAQEPFERSRPTYATAPPPSMLSQRAGYSPAHHHAPYPHTYAPREPSPAPERVAPPMTSMPPPPAPPFSHGYTSFTQRPSYPPVAAAAQPSTSVYQPSITQPAPTHPELARSSLTDPGRIVYGDSVKRHLDMYDFEAAINEIAESSSHMYEFSRNLGGRMHQAQRSGVTPGTLPGVNEIDDLMAKSRSTLDSLSRMREVIVAQQQAAFIQQAQEQQYKNQDDKRDSVHHIDDSKAGGFAGPESKKRRGVSFQISI